ncbi:MAG: MBL fold metallo-hydrolase, partial [Promethearchaeota archaeon]
MTFINSEGKFNENTYLLDAELFKMKYNLAIYIIEHDDTRLMIDTPSELMVRRFIKKLKNFNLYPIHKIILTHSHFDHVQGVEKLKKLIQETDIEVYASKEALKNLKNPE